MRAPIYRCGRVWISLAVLALLVSGPALAELYRWVDEHGVVNMTNREDWVPEDQWDAVSVIQEPSTPFLRRAGILALLAGYTVLILAFLQLRIRLREAEDANPRYRYVPPPGPAPGASAPLSPFSVLGVKPDANSDELQQAYRQKMHEYHPDRVATLGEELQELANRKSKEINSAYQQIQQLRSGR